MPQCDTQVTLCKYRLEQPASKIAPSIPWYATPPFADNRVAAASLSVESYQLCLVVMPTRIPSRPLLTPLSRRESPFRRHSQKVWCAATLDCLVLASSSGFVRKRHAGSHLQGDILLSVHQTRAKNKYLTKIRLDPKASHKSILRSGSRDGARFSVCGAAGNAELASCRVDLYRRAGGRGPCYACRSGKWRSSRSCRLSADAMDAPPQESVVKEGDTDAMCA